MRIVLTECVFQVLLLLTSDNVARLGC